MESVPGGQAKDCSNVATYFNKDFMVYICDNHGQPSQRENGVKLGGKTEIEEVEEALEVLKMCTKSLLVAIKSNNGQETKEYTIATEETYKKIIEVSKEIANIKETQEYENNEGIILEINSLYGKLEDNAIFNKFCRENCLYLIGDFLKANKSNIGNILGLNLIQQDEKYKNEDCFVIDELQLLKKEFRDFKSRAITYLNPQSRKGLSQCYELITNKKDEIFSVGKMILDVSDPKDSEFMKLMENDICSDLTELSISTTNDNIQTAKDFIFSSFPLCTRRFDFHNTGRTISSDRIIDAVGYCSPKVSSTLYLYKFEINQNQMKSLFLMVAKKLINFGFGYCKIKLDTVPNLENCLVGSIIQTLVLSFGGMPEYGDWRKHPESFVNLIKGLSRSRDFKKNLASLHMTQGGMAKDKIQQILDSNGFGKVKIENHSE